MTAGNAAGGTLTQIALASYVSAGLTDTDGSETLSLTFGGLPTGAQIVTSTNTYNVSGDSITILGSELASAKLQIASSYTGLLDVTVSGTATENTGGATVTTSPQMLELHIQPASGVVTATELTDMPGISAQVLTVITQAIPDREQLRLTLIEGYAGNDVLTWPWRCRYPGWRCRQRYLDRRRWGRHVQVVAGRPWNGWNPCNGHHLSMAMHSTRQAANGWICVTYWLVKSHSDAGNLANYLHFREIWIDPVLKFDGQVTSRRQILGDLRRNLGNQTK